MNEEYWHKIFKRYLSCYSEIVLSRKNEIICDAEMTNRFDSLLSDIMLTFASEVEEEQKNDKTELDT